MRRSTMVKLTLLPILASATMAGADPPADGYIPRFYLPTCEPGYAPMAPEDGYGAGATERSDPDAPVDPRDIQVGSCVPVFDIPSTTSTHASLACEDDPNWRTRLDCGNEEHFADDDDGTIRGGFGGYFWSAGG